MTRTIVRGVFWTLLAATIILLPYVVGGLAELLVFGTNGL